MSRLNASIKLVVLLGDAILLLLAAATAAAASMIISGKIITLDFEQAKKISIWVLSASSVFILCTFCGCCGAFNQVIRKGVCSGRRILCFHQLLLLAVFASCVFLSNKLQLREMSIELVIEDIEKYQEYDSFEYHLDAYFNGAYFEAICATSQDQDRSTEWVLDWIDKKCPKSMQQEKCAVSDDEREETCGTLSCPAPIWRLDRCCPSEELCLVEGNKKACPYNRCRGPVLNQVRSLVKPALVSLRIVGIISSVMVVLTCLLICYNPRDDIEMELLKVC